MDKFIEFNHTVVPVVEEQNEEFWFVGNVVAEALGYKQPRQSLARILERNPEDFIGYTRRCQIDTSSGKQNTTIMNEEGIYVLCMLAKTPKAIRFRRTVAEKIKEWRQAGQAMPEPESNLEVLEHQLQLFSSLVTQIKDQNQRIEHVEAEVTDMKRGLIDINQPLREQFVAITRQTSGLAQMDYRDVFAYTYQLIREQMHIDVVRRANNRSQKIGKKVRPLDIIEELGMMGYAVQLSKVIQDDLNPKSPRWREEISKRGS